MPRSPAGPYLEWKMVERQLTYAERSPATQPWLTLATRNKRAALRNRPGPRTSFSRPRAAIFARRQLLWQRTGHECSRTHSAFEIAFGQKLRIGIEDRNARDPKFRSQCSSRRNLLACAQVSSYNGCAVRVVDLSVQRLGCLAINSNDRRESAGDSLHQSDYSGHTGMSLNGHFPDHYRPGKSNQCTCATSSFIEKIFL